MTRAHRFTAALALTGAILAGAGCGGGKTAPSSGVNPIPQPAVGDSPAPTVVLPGNPAAVGPNGPGR